VRVGAFHLEIDACGKSDAQGAFRTLDFNGTADERQTDAFGHFQYFASYA